MGETLQYVAFNGYLNVLIPIEVVYRSHHRKLKTMKSKQTSKMLKSAKQVKQELHMTADVNGWFDGEKFIPFSSMSDEHLQRAKLHAQRKEIFYHNRTCVFSELVEKIDDEAEKRGKTLRDHNTEFHKNNRMIKNVTVQA